MSYTQVRAILWQAIKQGQVWFSESLLLYELDDMHQSSRVHGKVEENRLLKVVLSSTHARAHTHNKRQRKKRNQKAGTILFPSVEKSSNPNSLRNTGPD